MSSPHYDLIIFGASSFVGQILTRYLAEFSQSAPTRSPQIHPLKWAIAGRSIAKLEALRAELGDPEAQLPILIADANNPAALHELCAQTRVVISTVGPYALYGNQLVKTCAETGTDYCDLTGEVLWMKQMIEQHEQTAKNTGARIVHSCGFDSIPSDLGVYFCQEEAKKHFGHYCTSIKMRIKTMRGSFSGCTVASMINGVKLVMANPELRAVMQNPYAICPTNFTYQTKQPSVKTEYDNDCTSWAAPFVMAGINTRVVFRSNALLDNLYSREFQYDEAMLTGNSNSGKWRSRLLRLGLALFGLSIIFPPTRWLMQSFVLPKPGEGPSVEQQESGNYDLRFIGRTSDGLIMKTQITGDRDPGYGSTAKMLAQAGICLAFDVDKTEVPGGFWTPATALGSKLIVRLEKYAGITFTTTDSTDKK